MDPDQRFCREGKCHDPVKPLPGIPQCVANPLDRERRFIQAGHQRPVTNARDPNGLDPSLNFPSNVAPRKMWNEPKWTNVTVPAALMLFLAPNGILDALLNWSLGYDSTYARPVSAALGSAAVRVALFMLAWHAIRVYHPRYY